MGEGRGRSGKIALQEVSSNEASDDLRLTRGREYLAWVDDFLFRYVQETLDLERLARMNAGPLNSQTRSAVIGLLKQFVSIGVLEKGFLDRLLREHPIEPTSESQPRAEADT